MKPVLRRMDAATYVKDIETSRAFYELLGFYQVRSGRGPASAWAVQARGGTTARCEISWAATTCSQRAEVKLADSTGHSAWACLAHADDILVTVPGAFIASQDEGLAPFLSRG